MISGSTNPSTNVWTQKAGVGGTPRHAAIGFSIGSKGYVGMGLGSGAKDFWEYDPSTNVWTQKADFGGIKKGLCSRFFRRQQRLCGYRVR